MTEPMSLKGKQAQRQLKTSKEGGIGETIKVIVQALLIAPCGPDFPVPAFQYPFGIADSDLADRRLSFRVEIFLRLFEILFPAQSEPVFRPHSRDAAEARRCGGVQTAARQFHGLHQAG